jgi:hypothetical protein
MEIRIAVPRLPQGLVANLVGLLGLLGIALAVGGLTGRVVVVVAGRRPVRSRPVVDRADPRRP